MTATTTIQAKMIEALLATIDMDDPKDTDQAIKMIRAMLENGEKAA